MRSPNKPDAVNPAVALRLQSGDHWRGVTDPERWATHAVAMKRIIVLVISLAIAIWLGIFAFGFFRAFLEDQKPYPGKPEFTAAHYQITSFKGSVGLGNTDEAKKIATEFAQQIKLVRQTMFSGGDKEQFTLSKGEFITFCQFTTNGVAFLCHVPELRNYAEDAKQALAEMAWTTAHDILKRSGHSEGFRLIVAIRGFANYGAVWEGTLTGPPITKARDIDGRKLLYPYFITQKQ